jgi:hypothetical protein
VACTVVIFKLRFSKSLGVVVAEAWGEFGNPDEGECLPFEVWKLL